MITGLYYGNGHVELEDTQPVNPGKNQVLLNVQYCGICGSDVHITLGHMDERLKKNGLPRIFGHEASAIIEAVGEDVVDWKIGDHVVVYAMRGCAHCELCESDNENICLDVKSIGLDCDGAFREYWTVDTDLLVKIPDGLSDLHAALVEPLAVCCHAVSRSGATAKDTAVVIGGGPIGLMTAVVLKEKGVNVVVSELAPARLANCQKLGLRTVDPTKDDLLAAVAEISNNKGVNIVFEASGSQVGLDTAASLLCPNGKLITVATFSRPMQMTISALHFKQISLITTRAYQRSDYAEALALMTAKKINGEDLISKVVKLSELKETLADLCAGAPDVVKVVVDCR